MNDKFSPKDTEMNWDVVAASWKRFKGKVQIQWPRLADDELDAIAGNRSALVGKIKQIYSIESKEAEDQIRRFEKRYRDFHPRRPF